MENPLSVQGFHEVVQGAWTTQDFKRCLMRGSMRSLGSWFLCFSLVFHISLSQTPLRDTKLLSDTL